MPINLHNWPLFFVHFLYFIIMIILCNNVEHIPRQNQQSASYTSRVAWFALCPLLGSIYILLLAADSYVSVEFFPVKVVAPPNNIT